MLGAFSLDKHTQALWRIQYFPTCLRIAVMKWICIPLETLRNRCQAYDALNRGTLFCAAMS